VPLANLLVQLNTACAGQVYAFAHSQGNVVMGEALRLNVRRTQPVKINTYVACEAAMAGSFYDGSLNTSHPMNFVLFGFDCNSDTPDLMASWFSSNSGGVGKKFNFYNVNDGALDKFNLNMPLRPDYGWSYRASDGKYFRSEYDPDVEMSVPHELNPGDAVGVQDRYEILSFITEPRSRALGAIGPIPPAQSISIVGFESTSNLQDMWPPDGGTTPYSGGQWHSGQFRFTNMDQKAFWEKLMNTFGLPRVP
jgi:hypothetical protein